MSDYNGLFEATMGASPALLVAYVLGTRYLHRDGPITFLPMRIHGYATLVFLSIAFLVSVLALMSSRTNSYAIAFIVGLTLSCGMACLVGLLLLTFTRRQRLKSN